MKKNVKMILSSLVISFAVIGTANAGEHCGFYNHYSWGEGSIVVYKKDIEAKTNVTGKCPGFPFSDDAEFVNIIFTSKTRHAEWERYNGSIIGIYGEIEDYGGKPTIRNPKISRWD